MTKVNAYFSDNLQSLNTYRSELMGIAALWIAALHVFSELYSDIRVPVFSVIVARGNLGVEVFLLLSGIGLSYSLSRCEGLSQFYKRRLARVVIPWLVISLPYWLWFTLHNGESVESFILNWSGLSFWFRGVTTVWYISFILPIYFICPFIYKLQKKNDLWLYLLWVLIIIINLILFFMNVSFYNRTEIALTRIPVFIAGLLLGAILRSPHEHSALPFVIIATVSTILFIANMIHQGRYFVIIYRLSGCGFVLLLLFLICYILKRTRASNIVNRTLEMVGSLSLEFYLISVFIRNIVRTYNVGASHTKPVRFAFALGIIAVSLLLALAYSLLSATVKRNCTSWRNRNERNS